MSAAQSGAPYVCRACGGLTDAAEAYLRDGEWWRCSGCGEFWPEHATPPAPNGSQARALAALYRKYSDPRCVVVRDCARALGLGEEFEMEMSQ